MTAPLVTDMGRPSSSDGTSREQSRMTYQEDSNPQHRLSVEEDFGVDIDLSPQLNLALREEVRLLPPSLRPLSLTLSTRFTSIGSSFHHSWDH
jgi:hypothetical protein